MIALSVNVNKVATLRNSRGGKTPSVVAAAQVCIDAGAPGITVHPRGDERHIRPADVHNLARLIASTHNQVEFNIEGDPRPDFLELIRQVRPTQCTLVPVRPGEITSQAGWPPDTPADLLGRIITEFQDFGTRVSLFIDPAPEAVRWAANLGAERIELYTEPFARDFVRGPTAAQDMFQTYCDAAELAHSLGLKINAGHDLDLTNLVLFRELPHLAEVSIGHALISRSLFLGLKTVVQEYLEILGARGENRPSDWRPD